MTRTLIVGLAALLLASCGDDEPASKAEQWCDRLHDELFSDDPPADIETAMRQIYTDALNDGTNLLEMQNTCATTTQFVEDAGGALPIED